MFFTKAYTTSPGSNIMRQLYLTFKLCLKADIPFGILVDLTKILIIFDKICEIYAAI